MTGPVAFCCSDCGQDRYGKPNGMATWHYDYCRFCGEFVPCTEPRDFGNRHDGEPLVTVESCPECGAVADIDYGTVKDKPPDCQACEPEPARSAIGAGPLFSDGIRFADVLPATLPVGARSEHPDGVDIIEEPAVETHQREQGKDADKMADTFDVPFGVQSFMFEELAEVQAEYLHDILKDHTPLIVEMARDRFRKGYAKYGSAMYSWSPERRLDETLQELADAVVYLTSGSTGR